MEIGLNQIGLNMSTLESRAADFAERQLALSGAAGSDMQNYGDWSPSLGMLADTIDMNISSPDLDPMGNPLYENIIFDSPNYQALPQQYSTNMPLMDAPSNTMYNMPSSIFKTQSGPMKIGGQISSSAGPENTVNDSWSNVKNLESYNKNPLTVAGTKTLGLLGVSPYSYIDHIQKSTQMDVPYNVTAKERYDAAYNKAIDFYNRTNLDQQDSLNKLIGALTLAGAGTGHQLKQGIKHMWQPGPSQTTTDDWSPNYVDWLGNMRGVWDRLQGNP